MTFNHGDYEHHDYYDDGPVRRYRLTSEQVQLQHFIDGLRRVYPALPEGVNRDKFIGDLKGNAPSWSDHIDRVIAKLEQER